MTDQSFDIRSLTGLSREEAARRIAEEGYNELPSSRGRGIFTIARDVVREPMFLMLVAGGILYLFLGEIQEALMLLGFVFVVMGITLYQERKTERALDALRDLSSPRALVIRDGAEERIAGRDVARGDILVVREGDRVPADAVLLDCNHLAVDESLLTGESVPVRKTAAEGLPEAIPLGLPCPTTIFTIGLLAFLKRPYPRSIFIVPILWCLVGSQAAFLLGVPQDLGLIVAGTAGVILMVRNAHSYRSTVIRPER